MFLSAAAAAGGTTPPPVLIRSGIGHVSMIRQLNYTFPDPCYFQRATLQPHDYLGWHLLNTSAFSESSFADAARQSHILNQIGVTQGAGVGFKHVSNPA